MVNSPLSSARSTASSVYDDLYSTPRKALFCNEENFYNGIGSEQAAAAKEKFSKRTRVGSTPLKHSHGDHSEEGSSNYLKWKQMRFERDQSVNSDAESEATSYAPSSVAASSVISVSQMRGWLDDFGKQNKAHYEKVNKVGQHPDGVALSKPLRSKCNDDKHTAMVVVKNLTNAKDNSRGPARTPVRFKPRFNRNDVEATNDGYASVQKLSAWLADDPTSSKKVTHVRKGINVISKSRAFEKDMANVIIEENDIVKGSVSDRKRAFQIRTDGEAGEEEENDASSVNVTDTTGWLSSTFRKEYRPCDELSDVSALSVSDKKKWLQNAFARVDGKETNPVYAGVESKHNVPPQVLPKRDEVVRKDRREEQRDDIMEEDRKKSVKSHANKERSHKGGMPDVEEKRDQCFENTIQNQTLEQSQVQSEVVNGLCERESKAELCSHTNTGTTDDAGVGFRAARELLVTRSKKNGNAVSVVSKVQRRRQKFEKLQKEMRRRSGPMGLLKPTWESADPSGGASTSYKKTFVDDIAPKKSFEELP